MPKVFSSGSCRLLTTINNGYGKIEPIHSMFYNFFGINFLGKLHNTKQHIQFIKWINDEIELPLYILRSFLTFYSLYNISGYDIRKESIKEEYNNCDCYIFEICSLKLYEKDTYQVQYELTDDYSFNLQTDRDLYNDLITIRELVPKDKSLVFMTHFRPNIIYNDNTKTIENREILYNVLKRFCDQNNNTYLYDPSILLKKDTSLFDGKTHFTSNGHTICFEHIYEHYIEKST